MSETKQVVRLLLNVDDVIEVTRLSKTTIFRRVSAGTFPEPRKRGGRGSPALWHVRDIERWCEKRER